MMHPGIESSSDMSCYGLQMPGTPRRLLGLLREFVKIWKLSLDNFGILKVRQLNKMPVLCNFDLRK